jgi:hypothetical protein
MPSMWRMVGRDNPARLAGLYRLRMDPARGME